ncbi:MAG: hypothetical protein JRJ04_00070 [Deltaproteobacteria bacterium]|nr:hypothetical protein [Deltaproteobacteria bacterium]
MKFEGNRYRGEQQILDVLKEKMKFTEDVSGETFRKKCEQRLFTQQSMPWKEIKRRAATRANQTRLKTTGELDRRMLTGDGFAGTLVRRILFAVHQASISEQTRDGLNWLRTEVTDYWAAREKIINVLDFLAALDRVSGMAHWQKDAHAAGILAGAVRNDHV